MMPSLPPMAWYGIAAVVGLLLIAQIGGGGAPRPTARDQCAGPTRAEMMAQSEAWIRNSRHRKAPLHHVARVTDAADDTDGGLEYLLQSCRRFAVDWLPRSFKGEREAFKIKPHC